MLRVAEQLQTLWLVVEQRNDIVETIELLWLYGKKL